MKARQDSGTRQSNVCCTLGQNFTPFRGLVVFTNSEKDRNGQGKRSGSGRPTQGWSFGDADAGTRTSSSEIYLAKSSNGATSKNQ